MRIQAMLAGLAVGALGCVAPAVAAEGPFNQAQLDKGKSEYNTHCRTCHAANGKGALGPALAGDKFKAKWGGKQVSELRGYTYEYMPQTAPKSLTDEQLDSIMSFVLSLNGFTPGQTAYTKDAQAEFPK
ncbi:c-type cytochrome [Chenggangzhangella methanolivorans]|jgi:mono/diheme cytochrome c family protein|uniref:Cytochrome c n=1 Tax=Chenggangzhangella methanolivorans TaxID=1437009 RepID=A0A9E6UPL1_9HYPH|nr:cytochrome c [Chenggangzhangella methanolivorans]QZO01534.1 cytochrome c [Chenggangzhangella methanolivorans]